MSLSPRPRGRPWLACLGASLTAASWIVAWSPSLAVGQYAFFPLWLGYVATINGLSEHVFADSLLRRAGARFPILFAASIPLWWFFERLNVFVDNWRYVTSRPVSGLQYFIEASIDFSTVAPAVMSTIFFFGLWAKRLGFRRRGPMFDLRGRGLFAMQGAGAVFLLAVMRYPDAAFPLVWIAPFLLLEPALYALGLPSVLRRIRHGDWSLVAIISLALIFNGFAWEMWNYHSSPKWVYRIPYVGFCKIFELPALGYFGYPFFGLIVFDYAAMIFSAAFGRAAARELAP